MESMKKEEAALKAAVKHHDFLDKATHEYMELTGQASEEFRQKLDDMCKDCLVRYNKALACIIQNGFDADIKEVTCNDIKQCRYPYEIIEDSSFRAAREEMLDLLPGYLQPVRDILREYQIFFGKPPIEGSKYPVMDDAELDKYYFSKITKENEELRKQLATAREAYKEINDKDDSHKRNQRVAQALGLSSGKKGNRQTTDHRQAYMRYVRLVRNEGKSREEALERVRQEFPYSSIDSARKHLGNELKKVKDWWRNRNDLHHALYVFYEESGKFDEWWQADKKGAAILENYWKCLIPSENL